MTDLQECLDEFEELHGQVMDALTKNEAEKVQDLITKQYACIEQIGSLEITKNDRHRLMEIQTLIQRQNALIQQASEVADYFLSRFYQISSFDKRV